VQRVAGHPLQHAGLTVGDRLGGTHLHLHLPMACSGGAELRPHVVDQHHARELAIAGRLGECERDRVSGDLFVECSGTVGHRHVDRRRDRLLREIAHLDEAAVRHVEGRAMRVRPVGARCGGQAGAERADVFDDALHLLAHRGLDHDAVADAVAILHEHGHTGDEVTHRMLATDRETGADEPGTREHGHEVDLHDVQHHHDRRDPGDQRHHVTEHPTHRIDALTSTLLGDIGRLAEHSLHPHPPERQTRQAPGAVGHTTHHSAQHAASDAGEQPGTEHHSDRNHRAGEQHVDCTSGVGERRIGRSRGCDRRSASQEQGHGHQGHHWHQW